MLQKPLLDRSCVVGIVQYLFNLLYYAIWWLHPFPTSRHYRLLLNVWFIDISLTTNCQQKKTNFTCKELRFCTWTIVHPDDQTHPTFEMTPGFKPFSVFIILSYFREIAPFTSRIGKNPCILAYTQRPNRDRTHEDFERSISSCSYTVKFRK